MDKTKDLFAVEDEIVVITGSSGQLGNAYVREFLSRGSTVVALDLFESDSFKDLKEKYESKLLFLCVDVTNKEELVEILIQIRKKFGPPTVLVNNAAIDSPPSSPSEENGPFENYPEESWDKVIDVNLKGIFLCCQVFGSEMRKHKRGSIINISSIYGALSPDQSLYEYRREKGEVFYKPVAYSASKSGIYNLTRYLAVYWAKEGIRVNTLTLAGVFNDQEEEFLEEYNSRMPMGRMANIEDYLGPLVFLASESSRYMTGADLVIDGGWTAK